MYSLKISGSGSGKLTSDLGPPPVLFVSLNMEVVKFRFISKPSNIKIVFTARVISLLINYDFIQKKF